MGLSEETADGLPPPPIQSVFQILQNDYPIFRGRGGIRTHDFDICKCCPLTTKVRGLDRISYPSFPAPRLADRIRSISS